MLSTAIKTLSRLVTVSLAVSSVFLVPTGSLANTVVNGCDTTLTTVPSSIPSAGFGGGTGESGTPWLLCSRTQLERIRNAGVPNNAAFRLATDIDLAGSPWIPLNGDNFVGSIDGDYFSILNMTIGTPTTSANSFTGDFAGLFTRFLQTSGPTIKKIQFVNPKIYGGSTVNTPAYGSGLLPAGGVLAGRAEHVKAEEVLVTNPQISGNFASIGFLVGDAYGEQDINGLPHLEINRIKVANGTASSSAGYQSRIYIGGILGSGGLNISRAHVVATVAGSTSGLFAGGIVGQTKGSSSRIRESLSEVVFDATASTATDSIGGLTGSGSADISDSQFSSAVNVNPIKLRATPAASNDYAGISGYNVRTPSYVLMTATLPKISGLAESDSAPITVTGALNSSNNPTPSTVYFDSSRSTGYAATVFGTPKSTSDLKNIATYAGWSIAPDDSAAATTNWSLTGTASGSYPGAVTNPIWKIGGNDYPRLVWLDNWPPTGASSPTAVSISSSTGSSATLTWNASTTTGFSRLIGYKVEQSINGGSNWVTAIADTGLVTSETVSNLTPGSTYVFRVVPLLTLGVGSASLASSSLQTGSSPAPPQNLSALRLGENSFKVSWDPPTNTGGLSITSYTLQVDKGSGFETVAHTGTSAEITGVSINSLWSFRVLATNVVGSSSYAVYTNTPPVPYSGPIVTSFSTREVIADRANSVTLDGMRLSQVTELLIGTTKLSFTRSATGQLLVSLPELAKGVFDLRIVYTGGGVITHQDAFTVVDAPVAAPSRTLLFTNFAGDGFRLPAAASRGIRSAVSSLGSASKIVCVGSTSGRRATASDQRLALRRAQEACNLAKRLAPGAVTEVRANPASGVGARFRSVSITITGS